MPERKTFRNAALYRGFVALALSAAALVAAACSDGVDPVSPRVPTHADFSEGLKLGQCLLQMNLTGTKVEGGNVLTGSAPTGEVVTLVAIKAGTPCYFTPSGATSSFTFSFAGAPCYVVDGLGTQTVRVTRVGDGPSCKDISHIEFTTGPAPPTTGSLQICSAVTGDPPAAALADPFIYAVAGQQLSVLNANCSDPIELPGGAAVITEQPHSFAMFPISAVTSPVDRLVGLDLATETVTVTIVPGSTTIVTITNQFVIDPGGD